MTISTLRSDAAAGTVDLPDRIILVSGGDSGFGALLLEVLKKTLGKEDCPLCEITHGPLGKRSAWRACEARLGVTVDELHRNQLPPGWEIGPDALPCILARVRDGRPFVLVSRGEVEACAGQVDALERRLLASLSAWSHR